MNSKSVSQIFKTLFWTGDINMFVLRGVFFSRYLQTAKLFLVQGYTENANGDVSLIEQNVWYF